MKRYLIAILLVTACGHEEASSQDKPDAGSTEAAQDVNQGPAGRDGKDGKDGAAAPEMAVNEWKDAGTGRVWLFGPRGRWQDLSRCKGDFRAPTGDEVLDAGFRGLFIVSATLGADNNAWTADETDAANAGYVSGASTPLLLSGAKSTGRGIFCVKNPN